jgi:hypothetical protein
MKGKHVLVYNAPRLRITTAAGGEIPTSKYQVLQNACSWSFSMAHVGLSSPFIRKIFKMLQDILLLEKKKTRSQTAHFFTWPTAFTKAIITTEVPHTDSLHMQIQLYLPP